MVQIIRTVPTQFVSPNSISLSPVAFPSQHGQWYLNTNLMSLFSQAYEKWRHSKGEFSIELNFSWSWDLAIQTSQSYNLMCQLSPPSVQSYFPITLSLYADIFSILPKYQAFLSLGHSQFCPIFLEHSSHRCSFNLYPCSHCYITKAACLTASIT